MKINDLLYESDNRKLKTEKGSSIKRSSEYGVGKSMGNAVYVHRQYEDVLPYLISFKEAWSNALRRNI